MVEEKKKPEKKECNSLACSKSRKFKDISVGILAWWIMGFIIVLIVAIILAVIFIPTMDFGSLFGDLGGMFGDGSSLIDIPKLLI